jgi:uncharacterized protein
MTETPVPAPKRNILQIIFLSPAEARLRAGWRLLLQTILLGILTICISLPIAVLYNLPKVMPGLQIDGDLLMAFDKFLGIFTITASVFLARRFIDRRSITSLGLALNWQVLYDLLVGIFITLVMMGLIFALEIGLGWTKFEGFAWQSETAPTVFWGATLWFFIFLLVGWQEELLSRGYHLQNLADGLNLFWGVLISSSVFGLMHLLNPSASWISTLGILLAGLFLALPYLLTRQLWLSIGLHIGWNFFEGVVFGFPVSGVTTYVLLKHTATGPDLWTGGLFGPEAGLLLLPAMLLGSILIWLYVKFGRASVPA